LKIISVTIFLYKLKIIGFEVKKKNQLNYYNYPYRWYGWKEIIQEVTTLYPKLE